jgi:predicted DCC family thiol-disulfide oxidoreductase YuxK
MTDRPIIVLYDGLCPLCSRAVRALGRRDRHDKLAFVDIAAPGFDPSRFAITREQAHAAMHVQLPDGRIASGMEAFRHIYRAVGLGWLIAPTGWPVLRPIFDLLYRGFARIRPRLPGRGCPDDRCAGDSQSRSD